MSTRDAGNPAELAKQLFRGMKQSQLPSFAKVIKALEAARGERFALTAEQLDALQKKARGTTRDMVCVLCDGTADQLCTFCDTGKDECSQCDALDFACETYKDTCIACDEGDVCQHPDTE